jgi:hypothetical protein
LGGVWLWCVHHVSDCHVRSGWGVGACGASTRPSLTQ